ncbi:MAG: signal recognition particle-docking protein FtsY [Synergistaceae bacterium]
MNEVLKMGLFNFFSKKVVNYTNKWSQTVANLFSDEPINEIFWNNLEEQLLLGDVGYDFTEKTIDTLKEVVINRRISKTSELRDVFFEILVKQLNVIPNMGKPLSIEKEPSVIIMIGVNGSGKTTTAGKLAMQMKNEGKKVLLAAADTFRAAAIDQLKAWGEKTGIRVVAQSPNSDPAAVVYDAIMAAKSGKYDVVIADTAGRLHTKSNLMDELSKVNRVVNREVDGGAAEILIVLDSVTGQNGFAQAVAFNEVMPITGVVLTKFDNTSKGGIVLSIAEKLKLPIRYIGLGEGVDDLKLFDSNEFVSSLLGSDD